MPNARRLWVFGVLTLIVGLVVMFPARTALHWFAPPGLLIDGVKGTIWSGSAVNANANGLFFGNLKWRMQPMRLFAGELSYAVEGIPGNGFFQANLAVGASGAVSMQDVVASVSLDGYQSLIGIPGLDGDATLQFERLVLENGFPSAVDGYVEVANLLLPQLTVLPIGGYRGDFFTQQDGIVAAVEDTDGDIDVAGSFTVKPDRSYSFLAQLAPKPQATARVREQLQRVPANERGQHELRIEGQF